MLTDKEKAIALECYRDYIEEGISRVDMFDLFLSRIREEQEAIGWYFNDGINRCIAMSTDEKERSVPVFITPPAAPDCSELVEALNMTLEWIDAVPMDTVLPAMPGFDRDYVDSILANHAKRMKGEE